MSQDFHMILKLVTKTFLKVSQPEILHLIIFFKKNRNAESDAWIIGSWILSSGKQSQWLVTSSSLETTTQNEENIIQIFLVHR